MKIFLKVKLSKPVRKPDYFNLIQIEARDIATLKQKIYTCENSKHMLCGGDERIVGFIFETNDNELYDDRLIFTFTTNIKKCKVKKIIDCKITNKEQRTYDVSTKKINIDYKE